MVLPEEEQLIMKPTLSFDEALKEILSETEEMLISKNSSYGNAALNPIRIFSKADPMEQLKVRIDDKLSRIAKGFEHGNDDTISDLLGYLILYKINKKYAIK